MEPRLLLATTYAAINLVNNAGQSAGSVLDAGGTFTTSFLGTGSTGAGDVTITSAKTPVVYGPFKPAAFQPTLNGYGNPGEVYNFVGGPEPSTTSQTSPLPEGLQGTGSGSTGSLYFLGSGIGDQFTVNFQVPIGNSSRIVFDDIDYGEKITIQAFDNSTTALNLTGWTESEYTGDDGVKPDPGSGGWAGAFTLSGSNDQTGALASEQVAPEASGLNVIRPVAGSMITSLTITNSAAITGGTGGVGFQVLSPGSGLSAVSGSGNYGGTAALNATLVSSADAPLAGAPLVGAPVIFNLDVGGTYTYVGTGTTNSNGVATLPDAVLPSLPVGTTIANLMAVFPGDATDSPTTAYGTVTINPGLPIINWAPANITYGTALGQAQLDATASVPGTFSYSPGAGAILPAGQRTLTETFTPTDTTDYLGETTNVTLDVAPAAPYLYWPTPANITYGTALGSNQLDATALWTVNGTVVGLSGLYTYNRPAGTVLGVGAGQPLTVSFTPTDTTDYTADSAATTINVVVPTTTTLSIVQASPLSGQPVSLIATVTGPPAGGTPGGTVNFLEGSIVVGSAKLDPNGHATVTSRTLPPGSRTVVAEYVGDPTHEPSTSQGAALSIHGAAKGDYDGDGKSDVALYDQTGATFYILYSNGGSRVQALGSPLDKDIPVVGDFDGDGKTDLAIYDQTLAEFFILKSGGGAIAQPFGNPRDKNIPIAADFDGDGKTDIAIYDQTTATFFALESGGGVVVKPFGNPADANIPIAADFDGDGKADIAIYDQTTATYFALESGGGVIVQPFGDATHVNVPVNGDFTGSGQTDIAVYDQTAAICYVIYPDEGGFLIMPFGNKNHANIPV